MNTSQEQTARNKFVNEDGTIDSFVKKCILRPRTGETHLFTWTPEGTFAHLKGYAVIPVEEYELLIQQTISVSKEKS